MIRTIPMVLKTYSELKRLSSFIDRFRYLRMNSRVGEATFGFDRYINQMFYNSGEWKSIRNEIIIRDEGCDLGIKDREIFGTILIHHMNPISIEDIKGYSDILINPEYLICTVLDTHNAIHYGDENLLAKDPIIRTRNDTCPWKI